MLPLSHCAIYVCLFLFIVTGSVTQGLPQYYQSIIEGGKDYSCMTDVFYTVSVDVNGTDEPECVANGTIPCQSLYYALSQLQPQRSSTWLILISSDQFLTSSLQVTFDMKFSCLMLYGVGEENRIAIVSNSSLSTIIQLKSKHNSGSIIISNLAFHFGVKRNAVIKKSFIMNSFANVVLSNITVNKSSDWKVANIKHEIAIFSSLFIDGHFDAALLDLAAPVVRIHNTVLNHSLAQLTDNFIGPVLINSQNVTISNCHFTDSKILTQNQLETAATSALFLTTTTGESMVTITGSSFTNGDHLFTSVISITATKSSIYLSNLQLCHNHFEAHNSLISIDTASIDSIVQIENTAFYNNKAISINVQYLLKKLTLYNMTFEQSQGSVLMNSGKIKAIEISDVTISFINRHNSIFSANFLLSLENAQVNFFGDTTIENNVGTAIKVLNSYLTFEDWSSVKMRNNTALKGGGLSLNFLKNADLGTAIQVKDTAAVELSNNVALLGGAVYVALPEGIISCSIFDLVNVTFIDNTALTKGNDVLFDYGSNRPNDNCTMSSYIDTLYYNISLSSVDSSSQLILFPGQYIRFRVQSSTICEATIYLTCNGKICPSQVLPLSGSKVQLLENEQIVTTNLVINRKLSNQFNDIELHLYCHTTHNTLRIIVQDCPLGFFYDESTAMCKCCNESICSPTHYQCSLVEGKACVRSGYWYGGTTDDYSHEEDNIIIQCYYPYCKVGSKCQVQNEQPFTFVSLPGTQDDQCFFNKGQKLCRQCRDGYHFTYLGVRCVEGSNCGWNLVGLILLAIILNIIVGLLWLGIMRFKGGLTFGTSLGPLIFIAFGRLQPFGAFEAFEPLEVYFSVLSLIILDNSILGHIPVCTPIVTAVGQQVLNYIGPLVIFGMIISIVIITNCCPRYSNKVFKNPIQVICLLALVSFWSLAWTSDQLLLPKKFGQSLTFVIDPNIKISSYYTLVWLLAIPIYFLLLLVVIFMAVSPFLSRRFNTIRIKPVLDVCQSCYRDKWRWYSSVYFGTWLVATPLITYPASFFVGATILIGVTVAHFIFHPYAFKWLNIVDTLILVDLQVLCNIVCDQRNIEVITNETAGKGVAVILKLTVYCLALLPLVCYAIGIALKMTFFCCFCKKEEKSISAVTENVNSDITVSENHQLLREKMEPMELNVSLRSHVMARDSILYDMSI